MSLGGTRYQWQQAWQHLDDSWQAASSAWDDSVRWQFEQEFWTPLQTQVPLTLIALERLQRVCAEALSNIHLPR